MHSQTSEGTFSCVGSVIRPFLLESGHCLCKFYHLDLYNPSSNQFYQPTRRGCEKEEVNQQHPGWHYGWHQLQPLTNRWPHGLHQLQPLTNRQLLIQGQANKVIPLIIRATGPNRESDHFFLHRKPGKKTIISTRGKWMHYGHTGMKMHYGDIGKKMHYGDIGKKMLYGHMVMKLRFWNVEKKMHYEHVGMKSVSYTHLTLPTRRTV